ncbi:MAG: hypothetical protein ACNS61_03415, partial [Candidatus Wenzhouxiangella sp. M2_3B_020]
MQQGQRDLSTRMPTEPDATSRTRRGFRQARRSGRRAGRRGAAAFGSAVDSVRNLDQSDSDAPSTFGVSTRDAAAGLDFLAGGTDEAVGRATSGFEQDETVAAEATSTDVFITDRQAQQVQALSQEAGEFGRSAPNVIDAQIAVTEAVGDATGIETPEYGTISDLNDQFKRGGARLGFEGVLAADRIADTAAGLEGVGEETDASAADIAETGAAFGVQAGEGFATNAQERPVETFGQLAGGAAAGAVFGAGIGSTRFGTGGTGQALRTLDFDPASTAVRGGRRLRRGIDEFRDADRAQANLGSLGRRGGDGETTEIEIADVERTADVEDAFEQQIQQRRIESDRRQRREQEMKPPEPDSDPDPRTLPEREFYTAPEQEFFTASR